MQAHFSEMLNTHPYLLADGAIGTNLFSQGLQAGEMPELWNIHNSHIVSQLHKNFITAGSDIILTNSFGANHYRLSLHGYENDVYKLNKLAANIACQEAHSCERPIIVAGSVGPTGEIFQPYGTLSHKDAVIAFKEQARGLIEGGVNILWAETLSSQEEIKAVSEAACEFNFPYVITVSFDTKGKTMMGLSSDQLYKLIKTLPIKPLAFGANCGTGAGDLLINMKEISDLSPSIPVIAKGNAGIPQYKDGKIIYNGTPEFMSHYAQIARDCHVRIIGGCCGTTPAHIKAMKKALDTTKKNMSTPSFEEIKQYFGNTLSTNPEQKTLSSQSKRRRTNRRHFPNS